MSSQTSHTSKARRNKVVTSINLEPNVLEILQTLQSEFDRDRSYLVNALVKDFQRRRERDGERAERELFARPSAR